MADRNSFSEENHHDDRGRYDSRGRSQSPARAKGHLGEDLSQQVGHQFRGRSRSRGNRDSRERANRSPPRARDSREGDPRAGGGCLRDENVQPEVKKKKAKKDSKARGAPGASSQGPGARGDESVKTRDKDLRAERSSTRPRRVTCKPELPVFGGSASAWSNWRFQLRGALKAAGVHRAVDKLRDGSLTVDELSSDEQESHDHLWGYLVQRLSETGRWR